MTEQSIEFKGTSFTLSVIHIQNDNTLDNLSRFIAEKVSQAPEFFKSAPVVVNVANLSENTDFKYIDRIISENNLNLIGITGCTTSQQKQRVKDAGLSVINNTVQANKLELKSETKTITIERTITKSKVHTGQVRSGQQIYAQDSSLTIIGNVSAGAEVIADGSIHIYGTLRGRAIAGAKGDKTAQIFCSRLEAELLSINGTYILSDALNDEYLHSQARVYCADNNIEITKF